MVTTIIITVLVSVFSTLIISYFIWQFISLRKLKEVVKNNSNDIENHLKIIETLEENINKKIDDVYNDSLKIMTDIHNRIDKYIEEFNEKIYKSGEKNYYDLNERVDDIYKTMEEKFEEVYNHINKT